MSLSRMPRGRLHTHHGLGTLLAVALAFAGASGGSAGAAPYADTQAPSVPQGQALVNRTRTTVSMVWRASADNVGVAGYRLFKNGRAVATVGKPGFTYRNLRCGTRYTFALEAYDAAGNASNRAYATGSISTLACKPARAKPPSGPKPSPAPAATSPAPAVANLWVDPTGGSCVRRATPGPYVDAAACASLGAAYKGAAPQDSVAVAAGSYANQELPAGDKRVTIRNAPGARPVFRGIGVKASNVTLSGLHVNMQNAKSLGMHVGGDNNTFRNGSVHGVVDEKGVLNTGRNTIFDHYDFYDVRATGSQVHNECVYSNGPHLTVRNSHFWNCATMDLFITRGTWWGQPAYGGITLVNNVFEHTYTDTPGQWHYFTVGVHADMGQLSEWRVVNNTFETPVNSSGLPGPGTTWANNLGSWDCHRGATFSHNVGKKCASSDKAAGARAYGWSDPAKHDFRLLAGSPAVNAADATFAPSTDRDRRPRDGRPDAGAYEYRP